MENTGNTNLILTRGWIDNNTLKVDEIYPILSAGRKRLRQQSAETEERIY